MVAIAAVVACYLGSPTPAATVSGIKSLWSGTIEINSHPPTPTPTPRSHGERCRVPLVGHQRDRGRRRCFGARVAADAQASGCPEGPTGRGRSAEGGAAGRDWSGR